MRALRVAAAMGIGGAMALGACGGDDGEPATTDPGGSSVDVVIADDTSPIARLQDVACRRIDEDEIEASGIVASSGDDTHYVTITVRFVDGDGVRVEIGSDSVSDLQVGESARWDATAYTEGAADVERCEVTATVS